MAINSKEQKLNLFQVKQVMAHGNIGNPLKGRRFSASLANLSTTGNFL
jgi:hypothetical protein